MQSARARATDPLTSHAAAERAARFAGSHAARILACLREHGNLTAHEISQETGLSVVQVDRRVIELQRAGSLRIARNDGGGDITRGGFRVLEAA